MLHFYKNIIIIILTVLLVFFGAQFIFYYLGYNWYHAKISPFSLLSIYQKDNRVIVFGDSDSISGKILENIDHDKKEITFTLTGSDEKLKSEYEFPLNSLTNYKMCYGNQYGKYCFGKTK